MVKKNSSQFPVLSSQRCEGTHVRIAKIIVLSLIVIWLSGCATYQRSVIRAKETVLRDDLYKLRRTIDEYTYDKKQAPATLDALVSDGYLKFIPKDPITGKADWNPTMEADTSFSGTEIGIDDIHSNSRLISTEGTPYSDW